MKIQKFNFNIIFKKNKKILIQEYYYKIKINKFNLKILLIKIWVF